MSSRRCSWLLAALAWLALVGCDKKGDDTTSEPTSSSGSSSSSSSSSSSGGGGGLAWYSTCGDPVCSGYSGPWPDVPSCGAIEEGQPCDAEGALCDFKSECNARLICAASDPKLQPGGCPISRVRFKESIDYVDAGELGGYYRELLDLRLATYRYRGRGDGKTHLGVILEDREDGVWADPANDRIDLYGYSSLAIAGVQAQAGELAALRGELAALRREVAALRDAAARCAP